MLRAGAKRFAQKGAGSMPHWNSNALLQDRVTNFEKTIFDQKRDALTQLKKY